MCVNMQQGQSQVKYDSKHKRVRFLLLGSSITAVTVSTNMHSTVQIPKLPSHITGTMILIFGSAQFYQGDAVDDYSYMHVCIALIRLRQLIMI